jgi:hypothetical protein
VRLHLLHRREDLRVRSLKIQSVRLDRFLPGKWHHERTVMTIAPFESPANHDSVHGVEHNVVGRLPVRINANDSHQIGHRLPKESSLQRQWGFRYCCA